MKNSFFTKALGLLSVTLLFFSACKKDDSHEGETNHGGLPGLPGTHSTLQVYLTDHQSLIFDKIFIDIQKVEIKVEDNGVDSLGGWFTLSIRPGVYDILTLRNGVDTLLGTGSIPANRKLQEIRITLGNNNSVVLEGKTFPLFLKDDKNEIRIKLDDIRVDEVANGQFRFSIDFDGGRSIREHHGDFELEPEIKAFTHGSSGRIEGKVQPSAAQAMVLAINGTDTVSARPEHEGEFKIVGLKAGTYQLFLDATANNYKDSTISNIVVRSNEDTKLGTIRLHQ